MNRPTTSVGSEGGVPDQPRGWRWLVGPPLNVDWKIGVITVVSTLLLLVDAYDLPPSETWDIVLYFVIPMAITLLIFRENPREYGFRIGDWKAGAVLTIASIGLVAPIIWYLAQSDPGMASYYGGRVDEVPWGTLLDLFGWEFFFRGWILFGYARRFGADAIWLQMVPFALIHLPKPEIETFSTILGGLIFGWVAWRTRSFLYPLAIHWFVGSFVIIVAARAIS